MNYMQPRKRQTDKKWDYTNMNDGIVYPIGYCREFTELTGSSFPVSEQQCEEHRKFKNKYHTDGHDTYEDACKCYKDYLLDHSVQIHESKNTQHQCQICKEWTQQIVEVEYSTFYICKNHIIRESLEKLFSVDQVISS